MKLIAWMSMLLMGAGTFRHDTSYSPDNDNVNPRNDNENNDTPFTYKDANAAIYQPAFMPYAMIGLNVKL